MIDPRTGLSDEPIKWLSVPTGPWGRVDLTNFPGRQDKASVYALSHVYSPDERTVLLMIHKSQPLRLWVNGEFIEDYVPGEDLVLPYYEQFHRVPIVLHSGRNTILVKATTPDFYVRIGDTPRDRSILLAEQQRFVEAAQAFGQLPAADQLDLSVLPYLLANVLALEGDHEQYERLCAAVTAGSESRPASTKDAVAYFCAKRRIQCLMPTPSSWFRMPRNMQPRIASRGHCFGRRWSITARTTENVRRRFWTKQTATHTIDRCRHCWHIARVTQQRLSSFLTRAWPWPQPT